MAQTLEAHLIAQSEESRRFFWHRLRWEAVRAHLPEHTAFSLVDVGAGAGHLAGYLAEERPLASYGFVEPLESLREKLRERHGPDADFGNQARFSGVPFVTLLDVLEHQQDDVAFLRALADKMDSGAKLLISVPALQLLWSQWDVGLGHYRRYRKGQLARVIKDAGFSLEACDYLFPELLPMAAWRRIRGSRSKNDAKELEFPPLPKLVNSGLYLLGSVSQQLRRFAVLGTSLFAVATRP